LFKKYNDSQMNTTSFGSISIVEKERKMLEKIKRRQVKELNNFYERKLMDYFRKKKSRR